MQDLDNIVETLEKNIRRSLDKISNLQIKNNELQDELISLKNQDAGVNKILMDDNSLSSSVKSIVTTKPTLSIYWGCPGNFC